MTVSTASLLKGHYDTTRALGAKVISSDFAFEIEGFEANWLLAKQCPWPEISPTGEVEVPMPLGANMWQPQQIKIAQQGQISMQETVAGSVDNMLIDIIARGGLFNAKVYEGTPQKYLRAKRIVDCFMQMDNPDRDWENRSQVLVFSGTLFFHYFGETLPGNSGDYR
ncbi:hypothetical protein [Burkholderia plantarii]|uniref:Uncharacterized protein n=1 Tax=Burkholderia plantarii TaxID=41899 RepID=A0A0B6RS79_BURPL|nr:hypothetical protein [Burkholderia plantarii]AJK46243.1 hypothetical protein BGL_1c17340 [Burkholderia plantarii]ALK30840.1 hypothetical protein bpln_1g20520 [Burkholderia plantarii]GLZ19469.1 hypothetical protein Bpla01_29990 [Burkholderia plantarii]